MLNMLNAILYYYNKTGCKFDLTSLLKFKYIIHATIASL